MYCTVHNTIQRCLKNLYLCFQCDDSPFSACASDVILECEMDTMKIAIPHQPRISSIHRFNFLSSFASYIIWFYISMLLNLFMCGFQANRSKSAGGKSIIASKASSLPPRLSLWCNHLAHSFIF